MKKLIVLFLVSIFATTGIVAQDLSGALGKLGISGGAKPKASYTFKSNMVYKMTTKDKKNKETTMTMKYYFSPNSSAMGMKIIDANDPDLKKSLESMDFTIIDIAQTKMFTFMNTGGTKMMMGISMKGDKLTEMVEKENDKIKITKTPQTKTILGYVCDGYEVKNEKDKDAVIMWVSRKRVDEFAELGKQLAEAFSNSNLPGKRTNYYAYNAHPILVQIAKEGRGVLGYSVAGSKGETMDMEFVEINSNSNFVFRTSDYKSMF